LGRERLREGLIYPKAMKLARERCCKEQWRRDWNGSLLAGANELWATVKANKKFVKRDFNPIYSIYLCSKSEAGGQKVKFP
jgi:hypothetical protein